ncbi:hypothetical protein NC653_012912 [Populus alba x Populus x berolinensis]|uniref:Uncharacterized protein n=1 Tax=Populus alba x Populus x berolinensis TaxID=444605 RepID=A0AAD6QT54_9ROSI|nr:hypothetical protein NC653_012912 [Populus alba x Populus x berolinensis]
MVLRVVTVDSAVDAPETGIDEGGTIRLAATGMGSGATSQSFLCFCWLAQDCFGGPFGPSGTPEPFGS